MSAQRRKRKAAWGPAVISAGAVLTTVFVAFFIFMVIVDWWRTQ